VFSLVFALIKRKIENSYEKIFEFLCININPKPKVYISDFEIGQINGIKKVFNNIDVKGCHFHFTQIIWRLIQNNKLVCEYKENENFRRFVKKLVVLSFLPVEEVEINAIFIKKEYLSLDLAIGVL
jgi:hypothetical protein